MAAWTSPAPWSSHGFPKGSKVEGVDTDGTVAVTAEDAPRGTWRPYLWKNGTARQLPIPTGAAHAQVTGISNGNVIGDALTADFARSAVVWNKDGRAAALPNGQGTTAINSQGLILGSNKRLVASLWQLTASAGAAPADGVLSTLGDDGSLMRREGPSGRELPALPRRLALRLIRTTQDPHHPGSAPRHHSGRPGRGHPRSGRPSALSWANPSHPASC